MMQPLGHYYAAIITGALIAMSTVTSGAAGCDAHCAALYALQQTTAGHVTVRIYEPPRFTLGVDGHEAVPVARAWRECEMRYGQPHAVITLMPTGVTLRDVVWEYEGARDCLDDGRFNGSTHPTCDVARYLSRYPEARIYSEYVRANYGAEAQAERDRAECASAAVADDGRPVFTARTGNNIVGYWHAGT